MQVVMDKVQYSLPGITFGLEWKCPWEYAAISVMVWGPWKNHWTDVILSPAVMATLHWIMTSLSVHAYTMSSLYCHLKAKAESENIYILWGSSPYLATMALRDWHEWQTLDNSLDERKWELRWNQHKVLVPRGFEPGTSRMPSKRRTIRLRLPNEDHCLFVNFEHKWINSLWLYAPYFGKKIDTQSNSLYLLKQQNNKTGYNVCHSIALSLD